MPSRSRAEAARHLIPARLEDAAPTAIDSRQEGHYRVAAANPGHDPPPAQANALASRRCAARVAAALKKMGYGFAMIPSTAKPKRD